MPLTSSDPIADMLTRIRNAIQVRKTEVLVPHSKVKENVAKILQENGFLQSVETLDGEGHKMIKVTINTEDANAAITEISRASKPGRRVYVGADDIPVIKRGRGMVIVSTSKGMMTGAAAKQARIGGELICEVY